MKIPSLTWALLIHAVALSDVKATETGHFPGDPARSKNPESSHVLRNEGESLLLEHDGRGFRLQTLAREPDAKAIGTVWTLQAYGYGPNKRPAFGPADPMIVSTGKNSRLEIMQDGITEWFQNSATGIEHGFDLPERPIGQHEGRDLEVTLLIEGDLEPRLDPGSDRLLLLNGDRPVISYSKLLCFDSRRQILPSRLSLEGSRLTLAVDDSAAVYPITIDPTFSSVAYLKPSTQIPFASFGGSVDIDGSTAVVGAQGAGNVGSAYVFVRNGDDWLPQARLEPNNGVSGDRFGTSVAISGDRIIVGADLRSGASGAAYIFERSGTNWSQVGFLTPSNPGNGDQFGVSVDIDGTTAIIGAPGEASDSPGVNGTRNENADHSGAAYLFELVSGVWTETNFLKASNPGNGDEFGFCVRIAGDAAIVGAPKEDSSTTGVNGDGSNNSSNNSGAAYIFRRGESAWFQQAYLKPSNTGGLDDFGAAVALTEGVAAIGAPGEDGASKGIDGDPESNSVGQSGAVYVFQSEGGAWIPQTYIKTSNSEAEDRFGSSVAIHGEILVAGAPGEDSDSDLINLGDQDNDADGAGAAFVFRRGPAGWQEAGYLKAVNSAANDSFGASVSLAPGLALAGAPGEDGTSVDVNGDTSLRGTQNSGAGYLFEITPVPASLRVTSSVNLGRVRVGRMARPRSLTASNAGDETLVVSQIRVKGRHPRDFRVLPTQGFTLNESGSKTLQLGFKPRGAGRRSAIIEFRTGAATKLTNLSGAGVGKKR